MQNHDVLPDDDRPYPPLSSITVPTLVIHGTADPMFPFAHGEALASEIPGARLLPLDRAGHGVDRADWETIVHAIARHTGPTEREASVVLVHGAFHGPWMWDDVVSALQARGHTATAVELPFTGFEDDVAGAREAIATAGPGVVVCAHSYGGLVTSVAARGLPVAHLIYLAAFMIDEDQDASSLWFSVPTPLHDALVVADGQVTVDPARARECFYGDSGDDVETTVVPRLRAMSLVRSAPFVQGVPAWREVPSTYIVCTGDRAIDPRVQRTMAQHAGTAVEWDTDHSPFLTRPDAVADAIARHVRS